MLRTICKQIEDLVSLDSDNASSAILTKAEGPLDHCRRISTSLFNLFPHGDENADTSSSAKQKAMKIAARLAWPLKQPRARKQLEELTQYKEVITLALTAESA
jgi:hypothetical protein